jgi:hypothetical protein
MIKEKFSQVESPNLAFASDGGSEITVVSSLCFGWHRDVILS